MGYTVVALSIANIFQGIIHQSHAEKWKWLYVAILALLAFLAAALEIFRWIMKSKLQLPIAFHNNNIYNFTWSDLVLKKFCFRITLLPRKRIVNFHLIESSFEPPNSISCHLRNQLTILPITGNGFSSALHVLYAKSSSTFIVINSRAICSLKKIYIYILNIHILMNFLLQKYPRAYYY